MRYLVLGQHAAYKRCLNIRMSKKLFNVAKELNVATSTIVDFLGGKGFSIENKPIAIVTNEMESLLLKEFSKSASIKQEADNLVIGTRPIAPPAAPKPTIAPLPRMAPPPPPLPVSPKPTAPPPPPTVKPTVEEVSQPVASQPIASQPESVAAPPTPVSPKVVAPTPAAPSTTRAVPGLKVVGTIDLDANKRPAQAAKPEAAKPEAAKPEAAKPTAPKQEEPKQDTTSPAIPADKASIAPSSPPAAPPATGQMAPSETPTAQTTAAPTAPPANKPESETVKMVAPELRGLKILGKIDIQKPERRGGSQAGGASKGVKPAATTGDAANRKRKRKKVITGPTEGNQTSPPNSVTGGGNRGPQRPTNQRPPAGNTANNRGRTAAPNNRNDEPKEVSKKEIEEKIKATMARIQGGGDKKKRQRQRRDNRDRLRERQEERDAATETTRLQVTEFITAQEMANIMEVSISEVIMTCMNAGIIVSINQRLDAEVIELLADEFGHEIEFISAEDVEEDTDDWEDSPEDMQPRPPIVTVMGHVDHGKTSLLDYVRSANVIDGEAGGITQHIGAYEVTLDNGKAITFLDTPGHEAFTAMRARGAKVTDIAIIIVAADDDIMPQTKEAISHAEAAGVPIVFAINKIDKPNANTDKIKTELAQMNYQVEEWGGRYQSHDISAKLGTGVDELLEKVLLEAEMLDLKANPNRPAVGTVLEASLEKGRGYVSKVLIQHGTLKVGDIIVAGENSGRVRAMFNERNRNVKEADPSQPVLLLGLDGAPQAGELLKVMGSEQEARQLAGRRAQINREQANRASKRLSLDEIGRRLALGNFRELNLIVKGDFDGSVEALSDSLIKLSQETIQVNVIHKAVGQIIESDVLLATASDAIIVGFQVRPSSAARKLADKEGVQIKTYSIIYQAIEEIGAAIEGMLEPTKEEKIVCQVNVREVYKISKIGTVAGCYVEEGKITRNTFVRLVRDGIVVYPQKEGANGEISGLRRFKDDVKEVRAGFECGISLKNYNDIREGDVIEGYEIVEIKQTLK